MPHEENQRGPPSAPLDVLSRGTNQSGVRVYNERLVLSLIRRHGALPKAEIARRTGLSAQTISVIMRQLDADELVLPQKRVRGKIGQPSVPYALNREGAYSIGLKVGRRSVELILMDFVGTVLKSLRRTYPYPTPDGVLGFVEQGLNGLISALPEKTLKRISGLGIAIPFELWSWAEEVGAPVGALDDWHNRDIRTEIAVLCDWPIYICNDATAACAAELVFGIGAEHDDYLYFFVGFFVGGGLVADGNLVTGKRGNAGALGSMPIPGNSGAPSRQLIQCASVYLLEKMMVDAGMDPDQLWQTPDTWSEIGPPLDDWLDETARSLAFATVAATSVLDLEAAIVDGAFPPSVRSRLVSRVAERISGIDRRGLSDVAVREGAIGSGARAIGGASLALLADFARDREVLFKD